MSANSQSDQPSLALRQQIQPPADPPLHPRVLGFELKPIVPPSPWSPEQDRAEFELEVVANVPIPEDPYTVVPAVLAQARAQFRTTLNGAVRFLLAENREQAKAAKLLPLARLLELLQHLVQVRPPADSEEVEAMAEALELVRFCVREYERIALRFAVLGREVTLFEVAAAEGWLLTAAFQLEERVTIAYPEIGRENWDGVELDEEAAELAAA